MSRTPGVWGATKEEIEGGGWTITAQTRGKRVVVGRVLRQVDARLVAFAPDVVDAAVVLLDCLERMDIPGVERSSMLQDAMETLGGFVECAQNPDGLEDE